MTMCETHQVEKRETPFGDVCDVCVQESVARIDAEIEEERAALAETAHARTTDPWTSHAAARSLTPDKLRRTQRAVLDCFREFGPLHHERLIEVYERERNWREWPVQSVSGLRTRTKELVDGGLVKDTGRIVRLRSGRASKVWDAKRGERDDG